MSDGNGRINVSLDQLRAELLQLELRVVDRLTSAIGTKADAAEVQSLRHSVKALESQQPLGARIVQEFLDVKKDVDSLKSWRSTVGGIATAALTIAGFTGAHVWFGVG